MKLYSFIFCMFALSVISLLGMNGVDHTRVAEFKAVLDTKDSQRIRDAVVQLWPPRAEGVCLKWGHAGSLEIEGSQLTPTTRACGEALRTFLIKDILYPVMYQQADVAHAMQQIDMLVGRTGSKIEGVFGYGEGFASQAEAITPHIIKLSLCTARNIDPLTYNITRSVSMREYEESQEQELILYVNRMVGVRGSLISALSSKTIVFGLVAVAALAGIYYWATKSANQDYENTEDELEIVNNDGAQDPSETTQS